MRVRSEGPGKIAEWADWPEPLLHAYAISVKLSYICSNCVKTIFYLLLC